MEDIIQFLIIAGALIIGIASRSRKGKRQMAGEVFPSLDGEEEDGKADKPFAAPELPDAPVTRPPQKKNTSRKARQASAAAKSGKPSPAQAASPKNSTGQIDLRSPQKAREAFIYAEIFTRKYS